MKKTLTKLLAAVLCVSLALAVGGCNGKATEGKIAINHAEGEFVPEKDMSLTVWSTQGSDYTPPIMAKENLVENWLIDKTRVKIENMYGNGGGQWEALLSRLVAGDNFPDLVVCGGGQGPTHFAKIAELDEIWELTPELLKTYAPDIWKKVPESMWERIKVDGKIYGIPYNFPVSREIAPDEDEYLLNTSAAVPTSLGTYIWIRDDILKMLYPNAKTYNELVSILEETGAPIGDELADVPIRSTEDFVKLLKDIQALDLKVGTKPVYAFGYAGADCWVPFARLGPVMMGYMGHNYTSSWNPDTKEVRIPLLEDIVKEGALLQNQLIREKVIDPESLVHTDAQCKEKVLNGQYATVVMSAIGHPPTINASLEAAGASYRYRPIYTQIPSAKGYEYCKAPDSWGGAVGILKSVAAEDVPQILNWMNTQFTDEYEEVFYWGPKDKGLYEDLPDGTRKFKDEAFNRTFIDGEKNVIPTGEDYGLQSPGYLTTRFMTSSKWHPRAYNKVNKFVFVETSAGKVSPDGPYAAKPIAAPPADAWSAEYASLDLVQTYWSTRSQWEDPFKLTLSAKSDEEFNAKWDAAVANLKSIVDVDTMLSQMTEIARNVKTK